MTTYAEILDAAMALPPDQRTELAEVLRESADERTEGNEGSPEISAAWREEIARRSEAYKRGELKGVSWDQVRDETQRKHRGDA